VIFCLMGSSQSSWKTDVLQRVLVYIRVGSWGSGLSRAICKLEEGGGCARAADGEVMKTHRSTSKKLRYLNITAIFQIVTKRNLK
jgi:hypothetical protein